ncbi:MAG: ATP synthase F1 subunit epsilon [Candidatus Magasanikbacteria bacterium]
MINFRIATPESVVYEDEISQVSIPTTSGEITVLPGHIPLVSVIQSGELKFSDKEGDHKFAIAGGFVEVRGKDEVIILANNAERAEEIDIERAEEARKRAIKEIEEAENRADVDFARLQAVIDREMNRIRIGKKYKKLR